MKITKKKFICPKCFDTYYNILKLTKITGICTYCRINIKIPDYIPKEQYEKWWKNYKWMI